MFGYSTMVVAEGDVWVLYHGGGRGRCVGTLPWWWQREMFVQVDLLSPNASFPQTDMCTHIHTHKHKPNTHTNKHTHT